MCESDQRQAGANLEKSLLKCQQDAINQITHLVEHCNNRFSFKSPNFVERYLENRLTIILKLRERRRGEEFTLFLHGDCRHFGNIAINDEVLTVPVSENESPPGVNFQASHSGPLCRLGCVDSRVLIVAVKIMEGPQKFVTPCIWLQRTDHSDCVVGEVFAFQSQLGFEYIDVFPEREVSPIGSTAVFLSDSTRYVIQGATQVVDDLSGHDGQIGGVGICEDKAPYPFGSIEVQITDDLIAVCADKAADGLVEILIWALVRLTLALSIPRGLADMSDKRPLADETYSETETEVRREAALKRMLATPHKPHKASGKRGKESSQSK